VKEPEYTADGAGFRAIKDWREDDRPRERLAKNGASTLSDAELLAILISNGAKGFSALDIARELLVRHETLSSLASCDLSQFRQVRGMGSAKAITIAAAFEIGKRIQSESAMEKNIVRSPSEVAEYYIPRLRGNRVEIFYALLLNSSNQIFREIIISQGLLNTSLVHPREVFRIAITESAASIILLHNHPSGNSEPSKEDITVTQQLVEAGKLIDIKIIDHIIVAGNTFTSFVQRGLI